MKVVIAAILALAVVGCSNLRNQDNAASAGASATLDDSTARGEITQSAGVCFNPDEVNCRLVYNP